MCKPKYGRAPTYYVSFIILVSCVAERHLSVTATYILNNGRDFCGVIYASHPGLGIALTHFAQAKPVK